MINKYLFISNLGLLSLNYYPLHEEHLYYGSSPATFSMMNTDQGALLKKYLTTGVVWVPTPLERHSPWTMGMRVKC